MRCCSVLYNGPSALRSLLRLLCTRNTPYGEFMAPAVLSHLQDMKLCPSTANGTGSSDRNTRDYSFAVQPDQ